MTLRLSTPSLVLAHRAAVSAVVGCLAVLATGAATLTHAPWAQAASCGAGVVTPMHRPDSTQRPFYTDASSAGLHSGYVGYELNDPSLGSDVWIKLGGFTGGALGLAAHQAASIPARAMSVAGHPLVYAYLTASAASVSAQSFTVEVWNGKPGVTGSTQVCTTTDGFSSVDDVIKAAANKVTTISVSNTAPPVGSSFTITATGDTGNLGNGPTTDRLGGNGVFSMAPAMDDSWPADAFSLTGVHVTFADNSTSSDRLRAYPTSGGVYTVVYSFTVRNTTSGATTVQPVQNIASGTQVKHTDTSTIPSTQISAPTITTSLVKTAQSVVGPPYHVTYQVVVSNSSTSPVVLDLLRDSPTPTGSSNWTFDAGSAKLDGTTIADPTLDAGTLVFPGPFTVPASGSLTLTYKLSLSTTISNSVVGTVGGVDLGASSGNGNQVVVDPSSPVVTTSSLADGASGSAYSQSLAASGGTGGPYTWSITAGSLPAGLHLAAATGVISGTPTGNGTSSFTVTATDGTPKSGSKALTITIAADTSAPSGSVTVNGGATMTNSTSASVTLAATDNTAVVAYRVAAGSDCSAASWVTVAASASLATTVGFTLAGGDGAQTVCVQYKDAAGNTSATSTASITVDTTAPTVSLSTSAASPVNGAFGVTATFSEGVTGFSAVSVGNGSISGLAGSGTTYTFTVTPATDGTVTVDVASAAATDAAGNGNTAATQLSRTADLTRPSVSLTAPAAPLNGPFTVTATFSESVTGFSSSDALVAGGSVSNFTGSGTTWTFTVMATADGDVTVDVAAGSAADSAGNANTAAIRLSRLVDTTPPVLSFTVAPPSSSADAAPVFEPAADENVTYTCSLDGAPPTACTAPVTFLGLDPGTHVLVVTAKDGADNVASETYTWTIVASTVPTAPGATSPRRAPKPTVSIIPAALDMLDRPRPFKQGGDGPHSSGPFTRMLPVTLHIPTPVAATAEDMQVDRVLISNDADFREQQVLPIAADELYPWELLAGPSGDRPVYVRFDDAADAPVATATIVLDQELPLLRPLFVGGRPTVRAAKHAPYCGGASRRWLNIAAVDGLSGLNAVQIARDINHPCGWRPYLPKISYRLRSSVVYLRVEDRVGNISGWYRVRLGAS